MPQSRLRRQPPLHQRRSRLPRERALQENERRKRTRETERVPEIEESEARGGCRGQEMRPSRMGGHELDPLSAAPVRFDCSETHSRHCANGLGERSGERSGEMRVRGGSRRRSRCAAGVLLGARAPDPRLPRPRRLRQRQRQRLYPLQPTHVPRRGI